MALTSFSTNDQSAIMVDLVTRFAALAEIYSHHTLTRAIGQLKFATNGADDADKAFLQAAIALLIERNK